MTRRSPANERFAERTRSKPETKFLFSGKKRRLDVESSSRHRRSQKFNAMRKSSEKVHTHVDRGGPYSMEFLVPIS